MEPPLQARLLRAADWTATTLGLFTRPLAAAELIRVAQDQTGLDDFGEWSIVEPLEALLEAYNRESDLSVFGRVAARWDILRFLSNLLRLRSEEKAAPEIMREPLRPPIFVLGLPRSGTTFLHNLLSQDPGHLAPRCWQTIYPYPERNAERDKRAEIVERKLKTFERLVPEIRNLHPFSADSPQECTEITAQVIQSRRFDMTHHVPSYRQWLNETGHAQAYRFHRRFLQHLQHQAGERRRWVLKCPDHTFAWDALRTTYPDAHFVFVHRDPLKILPSVAKLTEVVRRPFTRTIDRAAIGRQVRDDWADGAGRLVQLRKDPGLSPERAFHVQYNDLTSAPLRIIAALYERFGMTFSMRAEKAMSAYLKARPRGGYGRNSYRFDEFGLDPAAERKRFAQYMEIFAVRDETSPGHRPVLAG